MESRHEPAQSTWAQVGRIVVALDLLIVALLALHVGGGAAAGADPAAVRGLVDPIGALGSTLDETGCVRAPLEVGDGFTVVCRDFTAVTAKNRRALVVSLYGPDGTGVREFTRPLPQGLVWGQPLTEVMDALGEPYRITGVYGTPTLVYMFEGLPYGSLELRFNAADRLNAINACLTH